ncbi:MAG: urease accessory protein UreD [Alsobacter sp.]
MYGVISPSEAPVGAARVVPALLRARGRVKLGFVAAGGGTVLADLAEAGGYRVKFPRGPVPEAVVINTGGGMAGGDGLDIAVAMGEGATATVTTQSAEKVYRADAAPAQIAVRLECAAGSALAWMPQETILFSGARLRRRLDADLHPTASLTLAETTVFGRLAMGERLGDGLFEDRWRIRRGGRLVLAETVRLDGLIADRLDRPALGGGARAVATVLHVSPDATGRLDGVRAVLEGAACDVGAGAWNGLLVIRLADAEPSRLRRDLVILLAHLRGSVLPRVWQG